MGHPAYLEASGWYTPIYEIDGKEADSIKHASFAEFLSHCPERENWCQGWRKDATSKPSARRRTAGELINPAEHEYRAVLKKVQRVTRVTRSELRPKY